MQGLEKNPFNIHLVRIYSTSTSEKIYVLLAKIQGANWLVEAYCPNQYTVTWECTKVDVKLWGHFWSPSCLVVFASLGCKNKSATIKGVAFAIKNCFLINHLILAKLNVKVTQATKLYFCLEVFCWVKKINCHFKYILLEHR